MPKLNLLQYCYFARINDLGLLNFSLIYNDHFLPTKEALKDSRYLENGNCKVI